MFRRKAYSYQQKTRFQELFGVSLQQFWDGITGFDVIKFDNEIVKSGDGSCKEVIIQQWGNEAAELVQSFLKRE